MSNIANITVFDGAATPVSHTLTAISVTKEKGKVSALWRESLPTLPVYAQIRASTLMEQLPSGVWRCEAKVVVPVMESISGQNSAGYTAAPKVAYENTYTCISYTSPRADIAGRRLARQILVNLLGNVSTSVAAATAGPLPELFDTLVSPT